MRERSHLQRLAALERDAAVARAGRVRRWAIAGTAALTAGFAALVAAIAPGKSLGAKHVSTPSRTPTASSSPSSPMPPLESPSQLGLQGPDQAPQAAPAPSAQPAPSQSAPAAPAQSNPAPSSPQDGGGGPPVSGGS